MIRSLFVLILLTPLPAFAHASLLETQPKEGARLEAPPPEVWLRFDEPVTPILLRLVDSAGREHRLAPLAKGETISAPLPANLAKGVYTMSYRVTSADAHPVAGALVFGIGASVPLQNQDAPAPQDDPLAIVGIILRAFANATTLLLAGGLLARLLLGPEATLLRVRGLALLSILGHGAGVWVQGGLLLGLGMEGLFSEEALQLGFSSTRGPSFALLTLGMGLFFLSGKRCPLILAGLLAVGAAYLLTGHAASAPPPELAKPLLALHVASAGFWIGALPILLRRLRKGRAIELLQRFSRRALLLVPLLLASGVGLALMQGVTPDRLAFHPYGRMLALKLLFVGGLLGVAALNRCKLTPRLARGGSQAPLQRAILTELILAMGLLLVTGFLSQTPPPRAGHSQNPVIKADGFTRLTPIGARMALIALSPAKPGANRLTVLVTDPAGSLQPPKEAEVFLALPSAGIENLHRILSREDGAFVGDLPLPMAGAWEMTLDLLITDFEKQSLTIPLSLD